MRRTLLSYALTICAAACAAEQLLAQEAQVYWDVAEVFLWDTDMPCTGIIDANGDAYPDLICDDSYTTTSTRVRRLGVRTGGVWHHNSLALFAEVSEPLAGSAEKQWALPADADADGDPDLYWIGGTTVRIYRLPSTYAGFNSWQPDYDAGAPILAAAVADVTGDGIADLLYYAAGELVFVERHATGWSVARSPMAIQGTPQIIVGESDGDLDPEFILCDDVHVWLTHISSSIVSWQAPMPHECAHPMPVAGDVDGDGDRDLVVFDLADYVLFRRTSATQFQNERKTVGGPATHFADIDGDGDLDGLCCGGGGPTRAPNFVPSPFRIALNLGGGDFAPAEEIPGIGAEHLAGAVDLDIDGDIDLVGGRARFFARGSLLPRSTCASGLPAEHQNLESDLDTDGDIDVESSAPGMCWINSGDGRFQHEDRRALSVRSLDLQGPVFWIDLDQDGDRDQVVQRYVGGSFDLAICLENRGGWFFDQGPCTAPGRFLGGSAAEFPLSRTRDLDGDGDLDLITYSATTYACELWFNDVGTLRFGSALPNEIAIETADFDADGRVDLLVADGGLGLRLGLGNESFAPLQPLVPSNAQIFRTPAITFDPWQDELVVADLGTFAPAGLPDIVAYHREDPSYGLPAFDHLMALLNQGGGTFTVGPDQWIFGRSNNGCLASNSTVGRRVRCLDFNGDGAMDLAYSPHRYDENSWLFAMRDPVQGHAVEGPELLLRGERFVDSDGDGDVDGLGVVTDAGTLFFGRRAGSRVQFGTPSEGTEGTWPIVGTSAPQRTGLSDVLRLRSALGGSPAAVYLGTQRTQIYLGPGLFFALADPVLAWVGYLGGPFGMPGAGGADIAFPPLPGYFAGARFGVQALIYDPAAASGISATPGLWLEKGW